MPRSKYDEIMAGGTPFHVTFPGTYINYDGVRRAVLGGGVIDKYAMEGYRIQYQVNFM